MTEPPFPEPLDDDDDDVTWALQTAKVQWVRGGQADALVWLGRAADSADQLGQVWRANDLRRMAADLETSLNDPGPPDAPLPRWDSGADVDDLLGENEQSGVTSIPPPAAPHASRSSYESVDELEVEPEAFDEEVVVTDSPNDRVAQLLGTEVELTDEVEMLDEELDDDVIVEDPEELDDDVIEDDALSVEAPAALDEPDEPVTQPQLDDPRFLDIPKRSSLPPPRSSIPARPPTPPPARPPTPAPLPPPPAPPPPEPEGDPEVGGVLLGEVRGLEDVPPEGQAILAREAHLERLGTDEEAGSFGLALVLRGSVKVMPAIADLSCAVAGKGEIVWSEGNIEEGVALRLVSAEAGTEVAVWDAELLKSTVRDYPWVVEDLKALADRFQALAGVAMGSLGERLDDSLRAMVTERCEIKRLLPGEVLTKQGEPVGGMYIMAAGRLEILDGEAVESELGPGEFLFGAQVLSNGKAPRNSRAGKGGALVLFAGRGVAHELLMTVPPLLEIFAL